MFTAANIGIAIQVISMLATVAGLIVTMNVKLSQLSSRITSLTDRVNHFEARTKDEIDALKAADRHLLEMVIKLIEKQK